MLGKKKSPSGKSGCFQYIDTVHHHHHQSLNREGCWGTTDDFATSFLHFSLFSTALWDLPNSRPVHSLMLSSHTVRSPADCSVHLKSCGGDLHAYKSNFGRTVCSVPICSASTTAMHYQIRPVFGCDRLTSCQVSLAGLLLPFRCSARTSSALTVGECRNRWAVGWRVKL